MRGGSVRKALVSEQHSKLINLHVDDPCLPKLSEFLANKNDKLSNTYDLFEIPSDEEIL